MKNFSLLGFILLLSVSMLWISCKDDDGMEPTPDTSITLFRITNPVDALGIIDAASKSIEVEVPFGTDVSNLIGSISLPAGATVSPDLSSGVDFSGGPVTFTVSNGTASDTWTVTVSVGANPMRIALVGDAASIDGLIDEVKTAYNWAKATYNEKAVYIPFSEVTAEAISTAEVIWFHHAAESWTLPTGATGAALGVIEAYYKAGGDLLLTTHASQYLVNLGRLTADWAPTDGGSGLMANPNPDDWGVGFQLNSLYEGGDNKDHPAFANLTTKSVTFDGVTYDALMLIDGGSKRDNAYFWFVNNIPGIIANFDKNGDGAIGAYDSNGDGMNDKDDRDTNGDGTFNNDDDVLVMKNYFESQTNAVVRGSFEWDPVFGGVEFFTVVEFKPSGDYQGSAFVISAGAYEWFQDDGRTNAWRGNIEGLTSNIFTYFGVE